MNARLKFAERHAAKARAISEKYWTGYPFVKDWIAYHIEMAEWWLQKA